MKRILGITVIFVTFFLVMNAQAIDLKGKFTFSPGGGVALPMGDFGDVAKTGFGGGGEFEYFVLPKLSVGGHFNYNLFKPKVDYGEEIGSVEDFIAYLNSLIADPDTPDELIPGLQAELALAEGELEYLQSIKDEKLKILSFGAFGKYYFVTEGKFLPYGKFGVNANTFKFGDESETKIGISIGAGGMYMASEMVGLGAEVMFHDIFTEESATQYITIYGKLTVFLGAK
jgi:opacity protein-like surface antigen